MKLLTIIIPCYNSEGYISNCLDSILIDRKELLDIIVVNDGSKDKTSLIAHQYADKYPNVIRVIDSDNHGHGGAINRGIKASKGLYIKTLDSDDSFNEDGLNRLLDMIDLHLKEDKLPDIYLSDYYIKGNEKDPHRVVGNGKNNKHLDEVISFNDLAKLRSTDIYIIHMFTVKKELLEKNPISLLEHTFYEDNQYIYHLLSSADNLCYLSTPIYSYFVGRDGQSISIKNIDKNYLNQINVMKSIIDETKNNRYFEVDKAHRYHIRFMLRDSMILTLFHLYIVPNKEKNKSYNSYIKYFKNNSLKVYKDVKNHSILFFLLLIPSFLRGLVVKIGYKLFAEKVGFK